MANENGTRSLPVSTVTGVLHGPHVVSTDTAASDGQEHAHKWAVLVLAGASGFMTTLDASIVNISLPAIARFFGVPLNGAIEWILIGYLVAIAAVLLTFGRLADMIGRKPILLTGLLIFTLGSALCGAALSLGVLIAARILQGVGGALIFAVNMALITSTFPARERGLALGINAVVVALGVSIGPTIGGLITQYWSWRWIFYVNVPIGILVILAAFFILSGPVQRARGRFDPLGAFLLAIGVATVTLGLSFGQEWGWNSPQLIACLVVGIVSLVAALFVERHVHDPVLDLALLSNRVFLSALISFILAQLAFFAVGFLLPFYLEELRGFDAQGAGLLLTPFSLAFAVIAPLSGLLADRVGSRWLSPLGLAIACVGLLLLAQLDAQSSLWDIIWRLVLTGVGQGIFLSPNTRALLGAAPRSEQGEASAILATGRVFGQSISVALGGAVFVSLGGAAAGVILEQQAHALSAAQVSTLQQTFVTSFHAALFVCAAFAVLGILTALIRGSGESSASS